MRTRILVTLVLSGAAVLAFSCNGGTPARKATATIESKSGSSVSGTATFTEQTNGDVKLELSISGAPAGLRAAHIHEKPDCSSADGLSAGAHWNPTTVAHGKFGQGTHHLGDLGNIE